MEAANVGKSQNTVSVLTSLLPEMSIYNIGTSGHTLYRCINNMEEAVKYYDPKNAVIIETDRVLLDSKQMEQLMNGELSRILSQDSGLMYKIQLMVPAVLPVYRQMNNWVRAERKKADFSNRGWYCINRDTCLF